MLQCKNLSKFYGDSNNLVTALNKVNVSVKKGEFVSIIGPSGSGKSTLLHMLSGLDNPSKGSVLFENKNIYDLNDSEISEFRRKKFGFVFQNFCLLPILSAQENILMPILLDNKKVDYEYFNDLVESLGLKDRIKHFPGQLSGGQQQRVAIARALIAKPEVVFADEPTGNLDSVHGKEVIRLLSEMVRRYHKTLVMITHDNSLAAMADRKIEMLDGRIKEEL